MFGCKQLKCWLKSWKVKKWWRENTVQGILSFTTVKEMWESYRIFNSKIWKCTTQFCFQSFSKWHPSTKPTWRAYVVHMHDELQFPNWKASLRIDQPAIFLREHIPKYPNFFHFHVFFPMISSTIFPFSWLSLVTFDFMPMIFPYFDTVKSPTERPRLRGGHHSMKITVKNPP